MNKVFCDALKLAAYVYVTQENDRDESLIEQSRGILNAATDYGLVKWVGNLPIVNIAKMTNERG